MASQAAAAVELEPPIARLILFVAGLFTLVFSLWRGSIHWVWSLPWLAGFLVLVVIHDRLKRTTRRGGRAVEYYEKGLTHFDDTWPGKGVSGDRLLDPEHPYAADLDLFGVGSLFERLCSARTRAGEDTLGSWLLAPAEIETIRARQTAVAELSPRIDLREDLELLGAEVREGIAPEDLRDWGREQSVHFTAGPRIAARLLAALGVLGLIAWIVLPAGSVVLIPIIFIEMAFGWSQRAKVRKVLAAIERRTHDLVLLSELLARLEREPYSCPMLVRLHEALTSEGEPASVRVGRLARLVQILEARENQLFAPFAALMLWKTQCAMAIDSWRATTGPAIAGWLAAVGEFEALTSLAAYAFENPSAPFPTIEEGDPLFDGQAVGHPLISERSCIRNDVQLGGELRMLLISGSNMSGKSTLLRTVGINTVLALAGGPVRARRLRVSVIAIGATLRVQDSLQAGKSRFYAELTRIRQLVEISRGARPLLFLMDEIFHGTNSHDRAVGAGAIVLGLVEHGAIGLVTTHDLALAEIAERLAPRAANVHFEDQLIDGTMHFDYTMRPGVVRHSNALALMRAVGLDV